MRRKKFENTCLKNTDISLRLKSRNAIMEDFKKWTRMRICSKTPTYLMAEYVVKKEPRKRGAMEERVLHCQDIRHARWPLSILPDKSIYPSDGSRCIRIPYLEETILQLTPLTFSACQATFWYDLTSQVGFPSGERNHWLASRCEHSSVHRGYISHYTSVNGRSHSCIAHEYSFFVSTNLQSNQLFICHQYGIPLPVHVYSPSCRAL